MLPAIQLNHELRFNTRKINNKFPDRMLAAEAVTIQLFVAAVYAITNFQHRSYLVVAILPWWLSLCALVLSYSFYPHPSPPPARGRGYGAFPLAGEGWMGVDSLSSMTPLTTKHPVRGPCQHIDTSAIRIKQLHFQRHLAQRMGGAGQAGVESADGDFDVG